MQNREQGKSAVSIEGRYRLLVESIRDYAVYMLEPDGTIVSWNPGAERFKGYTADEIIGQNFSRFYTEDDRKLGIPQKALKTALDTGKFEAEGWRVRKDGTRFWASVIIDPIHGTDGDLVGFAKITRDLTDRKKTEEALQRSERQFRMLVQGVTDYAIYMLDKNGYVTNWNVGAERIKGYRPDEIIGRHFSTFYTAEDVKAGQPQKAITTAAREGRFEKEGKRIRKDGSIFWAHVIIDPIRDDNGDIIGYAKITRDITERRENQERFERTREALLQSQKMEAIGQLTGGVAHDFNNLLMAVLGSLELMRKRMPQDPRLLKLLDNAVLGAQRGATLTKRMLAFARRQDLEQRAVDLGDLVGGMTDLLERSIGPSIGISTRLAHGLKAVSADANQLEMAVLNLVVNARDAMPDGGQIVIAAHEETVVGQGQGQGLKPGGYVRLSVSDTGHGMDEATLKRAAEPFFTTKGVGKGTGLGLSMVHGLVEQFGGRFTLESQPGKGTTAELWLPLASSMESKEAQPASAAQPLHRALAVLAVDDDHLVLTNTIAMLEDLGHVAFAASSGREALAIAERQKIDLLVTDQAMPQMTGIKLIEQMRKQRPFLPFILATGYAELPVETSVEALFGVRRLAKPFTLHQLSSAIEDATAGLHDAKQVLAFRTPAADKS